MSKVTVLGGGGAVGSIATKTLASSGVFSDMVIADINMAAAKKGSRKLEEPNSLLSSSMPKARRH